MQLCASLLLAEIAWFSSLAVPGMLLTHVVVWMLGYCGLSSDTTRPCLGLSLVPPSLVIVHVQMRASSNSGCVVFYGRFRRVPLGMVHPCSDPKSSHGARGATTPSTYVPGTALLSGMIAVLSSLPPPRAAHRNTAEHSVNLRRPPLRSSAPSQRPVHAHEPTKPWASEARHHWHAVRDLRGRGPAHVCPPSQPVSPGPWTVSPV